MKISVVVILVALLFSVSCDEQQTPVVTVHKLPSWVAVKNKPFAAVTCYKQIADLGPSCELSSWHSDLYSCRASHLWGSTLKDYSNHRTQIYVATCRGPVGCSSTVQSLLCFDTRQKLGYEIKDVVDLANKLPVTTKY